MYPSVQRYLWIVGFLCMAWSVRAEAVDPIRVLMLGGGDSHTFARDVEPYLEFLRTEKHHEVTYTESLDLLDYENLRGFDVLILHCCRNHPANPDETPAALRESLVRFNQEGGGIIFMHCAVASFSDWKDYIDLTGGIWVWGESQHDPYRKIPSQVLTPDHPVTEGLPQEFEFPDEFYHTLRLLPSSQVLIQGTHQKDGKSVPEPLVWIARDSEKGRAMTVIYGHDQAAWNHETFRRLLLNSIEWAAFRK